MNGVYSCRDSMQTDQNLPDSTATTKSLRPPLILKQNLAKLNSKVYKS